jgi:hypothetical protein
MTWFKAWLLFGASTLAAYTTPPNYTFSPWIPESLLLQPVLQGSYQSSQLATLQASLGTAYNPYALEIGVEAFHSKKTSFSFEDFYLNGRWVLWDENLGDAVTVAIGGQLSLVSMIAVKEKALFHYGNFESVLFGSVGSEYYCSEFSTQWKNRWWVTGGAGIANQRSPWYIANGAFEVAINPLQRFRVFADANIGQGRMQKGVDVGLAGTVESCDWGSLDFSYAYRVFARRIPKGVSIYTISYYYPFGL